MNDEFFAAAGAGQDESEDPPVVTNAGTISGGGIIGVSHSVTGFAYTGAGTLTYSWEVNNVAVATTATFTPGEEHDGDTLTRVTAVTNSGGSDSDETAGVAIKYAVPVAAESLGTIELGLNVAITPINVAADFTVVGDADKSGCTFSLHGTSDALPTGLSLSAAGVITGTPTIEVVRTIVVQCTNSGGSDTTTFDLDVEFEVTGGTIVNYTIASVEYQAHILTGTQSLTVVRGFRDDAECELIGGGASGAAGSNGSGGGGAGDRKVLTDLELEAGTYNGSTGAGGTNVTTGGNQGNDGGATTMFGTTADGGGGGGNVGTDGRAGGCGGGGGGATVTGVDRAGGDGTSAEDRDGGTGFGNTTAANRAGGGGGGKGGNGGAATSTNGGDGGAGVTSDFATGTGANVCGGGGGSNNGSGGSGGTGSHGGGNGSFNNGAPSAGTTAGSGGGGRGNAGGGSTAGAAGQRIVRYPKAA